MKGSKPLKRFRSVPASKKVTDFFLVKREDSKEPPLEEKPSSPRLKEDLERHANTSRLPISSSYEPIVSGRSTSSKACTSDDNKPEIQTLICFICNQHFDQIVALEAHINLCLKRGATTSADVTFAGPSSSAASSTSCPVCRCNLSHLGLSFQERHVNQCLDQSLELQASNQTPPLAHLRALGLTQLCPACNSAWRLLDLNDNNSLECRYEHFKRCCELRFLESSKVIEELISHNSDAERVNGAKKSAGSSTQVSEFGEFKVDTIKHQFEDSDNEDEAFQERDLSHAIFESYKPTPLERSLDRQHTKLALKASKLSVPKKRKKIRSNLVTCDLTPPIEACAHFITLGLARCSWALRPPSIENLKLVQDIHVLVMRDKVTSPTRFQTEATRAPCQTSLWLQASMVKPIPKVAFDPSSSSGLSKI